MANLLTKGAVLKMATQTSDASAVMDSPILQMLSVKRLNAQGGNPNAQDRYRMILSDGEHFIQAMGASQANDKLQTNKFQRETIIKLTNYALNDVQGRRIVIVLDADVVSQHPEKIGSPANVSEVLEMKSKHEITEMQQKQAQSYTYQPQIQQPVRQQAHVPQAQNQPVDNPNIHGALFPIQSLNPYQNRWTIRAKVQKKSDIRHWSNQKGDGKLFNVTLADESGEIKATGFNETCDNLYPLFEEGKVYYISKAQVKIASKKYNSNINNEYELTFDHNSEVTICADASDMKMPEIKYTFVEIQQLYDFEKDAIVDLIAVLKDMGELQEFTAKTTQKQMVKRELTLVDRSNTSVRLTLFGKQAEAFNVEEQHPVIAFKSVKVSDYNGRSLTLLASGSMTMNLDITEAHALRGWFDKEGRITEPISIQDVTSPNNTMSAKKQRRSQRNYLEDIEGQRLGLKDKPDYITVKATVSYIKSDKTVSYTACPGENCNKKVLQEGDQWRCEKCNRTYGYCDYRYVLTFQAADETTSAWLQSFNDQGAQLLNMSANELEQLKANADGSYEKVFEKAQFQTFIFTLKIKQESYQDTLKVRSSVFQMEPVNHAKEAAYLCNLIESLQ